MRRGEIKPINMNPHLFLNKGEKICKPCKGWGFKIGLKRKGEDQYEYLKDKVCPRCLGRCSLEFVDAVLGYNSDKRWA